MPVYLASDEDAYRNLQRNRFGRWHRAAAKDIGADPDLASQRLLQPFFTPLIDPVFSVQNDDRFFAIGSCFARGIEAALLARKMEVFSAAPEFKSLQAINPQVTGLGFTNKYNTFSIRNELEWALDPTARFPEESIIDLGRGLWHDPHTNPTLPLADREETLSRRSMLQQVTGRVAQCRLVVVTLGLAEVWWDMRAATFINTTPPPEAIGRYAGRYQFRVSNFSENLAGLEEIHALLQRFGHPDTQIIVTVSPVPLMATFTQEDVVIANSFSKCLLRAVAQEWAAAHQNVHYFPSYEIILNSARDVAWLDDLRHVRGELVNHIIDLFLKNHLKMESSNPEG